MKKMPTCPQCEKRKLRPEMATLPGATHGESFELLSDALCCPNCGFKTVPLEKMGDFALRIADAYRAKHGLLTSSQIKDRRLDLGMSQQQFAAYLGVGSSSVKRWELGHIQDKAMNDLILLKTDAEWAEANASEVLVRLGKSVPHCPSSGSELYPPSFGEGLRGVWEITDRSSPYTTATWNCTVRGGSPFSTRPTAFDHEEDQDSPSLGLVA